MPRPNTQESSYIPTLNHIAPIFEGGQGYLNGNFQDPTSIGQHRRLNNPVFEPDYIGVGLRRNGNEPSRRMKNFPLPPSVPMHNHPLVFHQFNNHQICWKGMM